MVIDVGCESAPYGNVTVKSDPGMASDPPLTPIVADTERVALMCPTDHWMAVTGMPFGSDWNPTTRITSPRRFVMIPMRPPSSPSWACAGACGPVGEYSEQDSATAVVRTRRDERRNLERIMERDPVAVAVDQRNGLST